MPRIARGLVDGLIYHILNRGNGGQKIFRKEKDYQAFIDLIRESKDKYSIKIFGYCLMPNHFHIILTPEKGEELSKWMQWLMTSHVRRYHQHYGTSGHIWQGRFKSFVIQKGEYLIMALRYVEGNPVRAGIVNSAKDWLWSSHRERIGIDFKGLIDKAPIELKEDWKKYVDEPISEKELEKIRESVKRNRPYGSEIWQKEIAKDLRMESTLRPIGRPKKEINVK